MPAVQDTQIQFVDWEDPLEKEMATHSVILHGESHGQRSLAATIYEVARVGNDLVTNSPTGITVSTEEFQHRNSTYETFRTQQIFRSQSLF